MVHMTGHATPLREYIGGADESRGGRPFINQVALTRGTNYGLALMPIETMGMLAYTSLLPYPTIICLGAYPTIICLGPTLPYYL